MIQLEGRNPVQEALKAGTVTLIRVEKGKQRDPKIQEILDAAVAKKVPVESVTTQKLDRISETGHHQGIIAVAEPSPTWSLEKVLKETGREACILLLDRVQDPTTWEPYSEPRTPPRWTEWSYPNGEART